MRTNNCSNIERPDESYCKNKMVQFFASSVGNPNSTTVNHTILTVVLLFNIVSLQFNTAFPSFYKLVETCSIEVFVGCT